MPTAEEYAALPYKMTIEPDVSEGGYTISFPDLPGCLTCVQTLADIEDAAHNAKLAWVEACLEQGLDIPSPSSLDDYSGQFKLRIPRTLHKQLAEDSKREGISMNQYCVYLLSKNSTVEHFAVQKSSTRVTSL